MKTSADITVTIHAEGDGHEDSGAVLCALERLLEGDLIVGPSGRRYRASVSDVLHLHHLHTGS